MNSFSSKTFLVGMSALLLVGAGCAQNARLTTDGEVTSDSASTTATVEATTTINAVIPSSTVPAPKKSTTSATVKAEAQTTVKTTAPTTSLTTQADIKTEVLAAGEQWCVLPREPMGGGSGSVFRQNAAGQYEEKVNLTNDPFNCGQCAHDCWDELNVPGPYTEEKIAIQNSVSYECRVSQCVFSCRDGYSDCDGVKSNGCEVKGACQ